jgi:hypothetical protein
MQVWKVIIRPDPLLPDLAQGYALAETEHDARQMAGHPDAMAFPKHPLTPWPGEPGKRIMWTSNWPVNEPVMH